MSIIRIDDCRIEINEDLSANIFKEENDVPFKTMAFDSTRGLDEFINACEYVYVRAKIPVSMAIENWRYCHDQTLHRRFMPRHR